MSTKRSIVVVTGSRADFALLRPVMHAIKDHQDLSLHVFVVGSHLLGSKPTLKEVEACFDVEQTIEMQKPGPANRFRDAEALGRGITQLARAFHHSCPEVVVVLGDRIEAFAAASSAAIAGIRVAHLHGGDRAEGVADESMRHAISKLAHIHLTATKKSAQRLQAMGEDTDRIHVIGSPAIDDLQHFPALSDDDFERIGAPELIFLYHPTGQPDSTERARAASILQTAMRHGRVLALEPNYDAGRDGVMQAATDSDCRLIAHLPRHEFVGLLKRARCLIGNSSAGLIECAALGVSCINVGQRQSGRERSTNVIDLPEADDAMMDAALHSVKQGPTNNPEHPFGAGEAGKQAASILASFDLIKHAVTKRNTY
ncbi:MAG: UDP-N-acetylglucosamine 2-epimerase [Phycisphaerales bacterium]|nr:UDP-N-acetylglucosamine 2-epimerase [Phycisphaerales bacterium]